MGGWLMSLVCFFFLGLGVDVSDFCELGEGAPLRVCRGGDVIGLSGRLTGEIERDSTGAVGVLGL
jgi:hypothetical protein